MIILYRGSNLRDTRVPDHHHDRLSGPVIKSETHTWYSLCMNVRCVNDPYTENTVCGFLMEV